MKVLGIGVLMAAIAWVTPARGSADVDPARPLALIQSAFDRMFNYPSVRTVSMRIQRDGRNVTYRAFQVAYKRIGERGHTLLRFTEPEYLRDDGLLMVEKKDGVTETWLYQTSSRRTRRVTGAHKSDAFYGSDLTLEDLEHHDWSRFRLRELPGSVEAGRPVDVVEAIPLAESQYSRIVASIERSRGVLLRVDFYRGDGPDPVKSLLVPPEEIEEEDGVVKPSRILVQRPGGRSSTELRFERIEVEPDLPDRLFTSMHLELQGIDLHRAADNLGGGSDG